MSINGGSAARALPEHAERRFARVFHAARCAAVLGLATVLGLGCSSGPPPPPKPTEVTGTIVTSASVNPSVSQRPSPVLVRVYELKQANSFNGADFISLYERDQATLGPDLVARDEMMMQPGESKPFNKTLAPETRFIGVFAAFRDLEKSNWRGVVAVQPNKKQRVSIKAEGLAISATVTPLN